MHYNIQINKIIFLPHSTFIQQNFYNQNIAIFMFRITAFLAIIFLVASIPFQDQLCLANSLIVGRDDHEDVKNWQCKVCDPSNKPITSHIIQDKSVDIKCIVSVYQNLVVLAFRYTNTALNVWEDMLYPLQVIQESACSNCKVQRQFIRMWQKIKVQVFEDLRLTQQYSKINYLHITGISLGGGLATISYMDIAQYSLFMHTKVTTFGAPRVGNKNWAAYYELRTMGKTKRYLVSGDPIPILPKCLTLLCNYHQVGVKIVCYEQSQRCVQEEQIPDDEDSITFPKVINTIKKQMDLPVKQKPLDYGSIVDHIEGYPKIYNHTLIEQ